MQSCYRSTSTASQHHLPWKFTFILQTRAGSHDDLPIKKINVSAFSYSKPSVKTSPESYTRKFTGIGGTMVQSSQNHNLTPGYLLYLLIREVTIFLLPSMLSSGYCIIVAATAATKQYCIPWCNLPSFSSSCTQVAKRTSPTSVAHPEKGSTVGRELKLSNYSAFCPRANPPNTELRRYTILFIRLSIYVFTSASVVEGLSLNILRRLLCMIWIFWSESKRIAANLSWYQ